MKISIVVPAFNEEKLIAESLGHIRNASTAFSNRGWETEFIVCDNNSTDCTAELARAAGAKVVFEPINQIARARNGGARVAEGSWLLFVDADSHPSRQLFEDVAQEIMTGTCLAGGSTVRLDDAHRIANFITNLWNFISRATRCAAGSFVFCETSAFREVGGFNSELFAAEEVDLSRRLKKLSRSQKKRFVILHRNPLLTSARKIHLYSSKEHLGFLLRVILRPRRTLRKRESCPTWYDGRR